MVLDTIQENESQNTNFNKTPEQVSVTQKHASEIAHYDRNSKTDKLDKRRSKTQVIPIEQDTQVTEVLNEKKGTLKEELKDIKQQIKNQPKRPKRVQDQYNLTMPNQHDNMMVLNTTATDNFYRDAASTQITPVAKA